MKFDYCISNPPYQKLEQKDKNSKGKTRKIYPQFWLQATKLVHNVCMIFPTGWRVSEGRGTIYEAKEIQKDNQIKNIIDVGKVFPSVGVEVNIVSWKKNYDNKNSLKDKFAKNNLDDIYIYI